MADPDVPNVIWVQGSTARLYRVQHDATPDRRRVRWIACTCTHGMNNAGVARCSHAVAALLALRDDLALPSKHEQTSGHPRA